jgi:uncharacterized protein
MLFAVIFQDRPGLGAVRAEHLQAHIDWLDQHRDMIPVGGSLRHEPDQVPRGGLWIAHADSKQQLEDVLKTDPFYRAGLRQGYDILHWSKAHPDRMVLI